MPPSQEPPQPPRARDKSTTPCGVMGKSGHWRQRSGVRPGHSCVRNDKHKQCEGGLRPFTDRLPRTVSSHSPTLSLPTGRRLRPVGSVRKLLSCLLGLFLCLALTSARKAPFIYYNPLGWQGAVRNLRTRGRGIPVNAGSQQGGVGVPTNPAQPKTPLPVVRST